MAVAFSTLTAAQQLQVKQFVDHTLRPTVLRFASTALKANLAVAQYLASPTGAASTFATPAADSVAGILAGVTTTEAVPVLDSGFDQAAALTVAQVTSLAGNLNTVSTTYWTGAAEQTYSVVCGANNILSL